MSVCSKFNLSVTKFYKYFTFLSSFKMQMLLFFLSSGFIHFSVLIPAYCTLQASVNAPISQVPPSKSILLWLKPLIPFPIPIQTFIFPMSSKYSLSFLEHKNGVSSPGTVAVQGNTAAGHNSDPDDAPGTFFLICHHPVGFHS